MMKKKVLVSAAVLALGAGSMLLTGFDSAATVDDVVSKYNEANQAVDSCSATADVDLQLNLGIASEDAGMNMTMNMGMAGDMEIIYTKDPLAVAVTGTFSVSAMGEDMNMDMKVYMVPGEEGTWDTFVYANDGEEGEWEYQQVPAEQMEKIQKLMNEAQLDPSQFPIEYTLGEEPVDVNGSPCYQLSTSITYDLIKPILEEAMASVPAEELDETSLAMVESLLAGMVFNMEMDVDAESYLPMKAHLDMNGSDFSAISELLGYAFASDDDEGNAVIPDVTLDIPVAAFDYIYDYSSPVEITVPEEALEAKENAAANDLDGNDAIEELEDALEELETEAE